MFPAPCVSVRKYIQTSKAVFLVNFFSVLFICILHHSTPQCYQSIIPLSSPSPPHYLHLRITFFNALLCRHRTRNRKLSSPWGGLPQKHLFLPQNDPLQPTPPAFPPSLFQTHCFSLCMPAVSLFVPHFQLSEELKQHLNHTMTENYAQPGKEAVTFAVDNLQQDVWNIFTNSSGVKFL